MMSDLKQIHAKEKVIYTSFLDNSRGGEVHSTSTLLNISSPIDGAGYVCHTITEKQ